MSLNKYIITTSEKHFYFIDYLKAIAILMVIYHHSQNAAIWRQNFFNIYIIHMAVPLFMMITGFNYTYSFMTGKLKKWQELYNLELILKRFFRLTIPFLVILGIEYLLNTKGIRSHHFTTNFIGGGKGPGSYYYCVMLQFIILYPVIFLLLNKYKRKGLIYIFLINILWEIIATKLQMTNALYRLVALRYIFYVSLGCWLVINKTKISSIKLLISFIIGLNFITLFAYNNAVVSYPFTHWLHTNVLYAFYIFPIFTYIYYNHTKIKLNHYIDNALQIIGKASWHIMLFQMFFYAQFGYYQKTHTYFIQALLSIFLCVLVGISFYKLEKFIRNIWTKMLN